MEIQLDTNTVNAIAIIVGALLIYLSLPYLTRIKIIKHPDGGYNATLDFKDGIEHFIKDPVIKEDARLINIKFDFQDKINNETSKDIFASLFNIFKDLVSIREEPTNNLNNREAVITSLASLVQIIKALANARNISFADSTDALVIADKLIVNGIFSEELARPLQALYKLGVYVRDNPKEKIDSVSSRKYVFFVSAIVDVINKLLKTPAPSRKTQVGGGIIGFASPDLGRPAATLYCLSGPFQGQRFPINKSVFKLGANTHNDLVIPNDKYISGNHAHINYDQGNLLLFDDGSRNGTFLNGDRLNSPRMLKQGDKIRLGSNTLELT